MAEDSTPHAMVHDVHFSVDASVIFQLGEHLISDSVQALVELIKNSYDADATNVLVEVDSAWEGQGPGGIARRGRIIVSDDGTGMTLDDLERGWLTLSNSPKRSFKHEGKRTVRGRTPLGEKGLGRLGAQRLGHDIEIATIPSGGSTSFKLAYSWDAFSRAKTVDKVELKLFESPTTDPPGTWITITGLKSLESWAEADSRERLESGLSQLVSPYAQVADFAVAVELNDRAIELTRVTAAVLKAADLHYDVVYSKGVARVSGRAKVGFFQPPSGKELERFHNIVAQDRGDKLFQYLEQRLKTPGLNLRKSATAGWYVEFDHEIKLSALPARRFNPNPTEPYQFEIADPGPFQVAVDSFDLGDVSIVGQTIFDSKREFKDYVKRFSGIRVYRDGFGIRVDHDWLRLSEASTSGRSYYGLRPFNTLGYVGISARSNPELLEKTDREGFQVTPHYENFFMVLRKFVEFTTHIQTQLRRAYNDFAKSQLAGTVSAQPDVTPGALTDRLRATLGSAEEHRRPVIAYTETVRDGIARINAHLRSAEQETSGFPSGRGLRITIQALRRDLDTLEAEVSRAETVLRRLDEYLMAVAQLDPVSVLLSQQVADMEIRLGELYEAAALGLTAEALTHEMAHITEQLQTRVARLQRLYKGKAPLSAEVSEFIEVVKGSVQGLRHQLGHLSPSLRYARDTQELMTVSRFLRELFKYHQERLSDTLIELDVQVENGGDFVVEMNRGKLTQVFDNLVLNSEYWLRRVTRRKGQGRILARIDAPFVYLSDTGPGVDPLYESSLFQPFVSGKPKAEGRGLGLFIIEQLLAMDGCTIALSPERNAEGRRFVFEMNFVEVLREP